MIFLGVIHFWMTVLILTALTCVTGFVPFSEFGKSGVTENRHFWVARVFRPAGFSHSRSSVPDAVICEPGSRDRTYFLEL